MSDGDWTPVRRGSQGTRRPERWQHDPEEDRRQLARLRIIDRRYLARRQQLEIEDHDIEGRLWHTCAEEQLEMWSVEDLVQANRARHMDRDPGTE